MQATSCIQLTTWEKNCNEGGTESPNIHRLLKLNNKKTIMVSPIAIKSLGSYYAANPLSSF